MIREAVRLAVLATVTAGVAPVAVADSACPAPGRVLEIVDELGVARGTRSVRHGRPIPRALFRRAAADPGQVVTSREGRHGTGVVLVDRPIDWIWRAVVDEEHHDVEGDYLPVRRSDLIAGDSTDPSRLVFQRFDQWGFSRWWVIRVRSNASLFEESSGRLWEVWWEEALDEPPVARVAPPDVEPLVSIRGSWLLMRVAPSCTLVEYQSSTDPGGALDVAQRLMLRRAIRGSLEGILRFADEHVPRAHPDGGFMRPDGRPLSRDGVVDNRLNGLPSSFGDAMLERPPEGQ